MYSLLTLIILLAPFTTYASAFVPLVGLPGIDGEMNFTTYMNALYALSISIAALLAVVKIIIAGVKWMLTDVVTSKGEAKKDIEGALIGLLVVVAAVLILTVINPALTELEPFKQLSEVDTSVRPVAGAVEPALPVATIACTDRDPESGICGCATTETSCPTETIPTSPDYAGCRIGCIPRPGSNDPVVSRVNAAGERRQVLDFICTESIRDQADGCDPASWSRVGAEQTCASYGGTLEVDPSDVGQGICTYVPVGASSLTGGVSGGPLTAPNSSSITTPVTSVTATGPWNNQSGAYRWTGPNAYNTSNINSAGILSYSISVPAGGTYALAIEANRNLNGRTQLPSHTRAPGGVANDEENDVWVRVNGGPWQKLFGNPPWGGWGNLNRIDLHSTKPPANYQLPGGANTIEVAGRSQNVAIRDIILTPVP